ncbi:MAG: hypothetical protein KDE27_26960 [Planctomycetes bacterium]|nr:hypothetical protein [Planctomycetota bacterium]
MTLPLARPELAARRPVWLALSELYLDTELDRTALARIAAILASSPYPIAELARIRAREVAPVLWRNAASAAGEWRGFDGRSLARAIVRRLARPRWTRPSWVPFDIGREPWRDLVPEIERLRAGRSPAVT